LFLSKIKLLFFVFFFWAALPDFARLPPLKTAVEEPLTAPPFFVTKRAANLTPFFQSAKLFMAFFPEPPKSLLDPLDTLV